MVKGNSFFSSSRYLLEKSKLQKTQNEFPVEVTSLTNKGFPVTYFGLKISFNKLMNFATTAATTTAASTTATACAFAFNVENKKFQTHFGRLSN